MLRRLEGEDFAVHLCSFSKERRVARGSFGPVHAISDGTVWPQTVWVH